MKQLLHDRYELLSEIGRGAQGRTYRAKDTSTGELVAVKMLDLKTTAQWKAVDLFEREIATLKRLDHPGIPRFIDAFDQNETEFYLVQSFVSGRNLSVVLSEGHLFDAAQIEDFAKQLLQILIYLHGQHPAVLHRDIKPANVIMADNGKLCLIDFGAVQSRGSGGTTVVGTSGYMPPEQLTGRAVPASDLYALGATLIHLATRTHPTDLPVERLRIQWRAHAKLDDNLSNWIDKLIAPEHEDRPKSADEALRWLVVLRDQDLTPMHVPRQAVATTGRSTSPSGNIEAKVTNDQLEITFHAQSLGSIVLRSPLTWLTVFMIPFTLKMPFALLGVATMSVIGLIFSYSVFGKTKTLRIDPERVEQRDDGQLVESSRTKALKGPFLGSSRYSSYLTLKFANETWVIKRGLSHKEGEWAAHQIRKYLANIT